MKPLVVLALTLWAAPVLAQSQPLELGTYAAAAALDYQSTYRYLRAGGRELNPIGRPFDARPGLMLGLSAAGDAALTWTVYRRLESRPVLRRVLTYGIAGARVYLAVRNYRLVQR